MGRVIGVFTPPYGGTMAQFNTTAITYNGFITTITDAKGNIRIEETDYLGRISRVQEDTGGGTTYYAYNAASDLTSVTDAAGNVTTINYNTLGQKINMTDPDMGYWSYTYDLNGNLYQQTDALGQTITFTYDALNRVTFKNYSTSDPDVTYTYDNTTAAKGKGRIYSVTNGNDTTTYNSYDEMGRPLSITKTISGDQARTTSYIYDYSGKTLRTTYPDGYYVNNAYHAGSNLLSTVTGSDGVSYASINNYSPSGKMISFVHGNNTSTTYTYDARAEKLGLVETKIGSSTIIQKKSYGYTAIGEISSINDQHNGKNYIYTYDKIGRVTNETTNGSTSMIMTYNALGNITSKTVGGSYFSYSYNNSHKHAVSGITYNGTTYSYTYDANGNMTYGADFTNLGNIQARTITYNADNMPTQISHSSNITTQLTYGGTGERVKKRVYNGGNVADTYYIGDHFEVKGGVVTKYIFAGNLRVAQVKGTTRSFFHKDHLGSSAVMTNASGSELESTEYMPFGSQRSHSGTSTSDYRYTDQELDAENGLYNYNARLYDPFIGRFISADTIVPEPFNPQSLNRYSYVLNNPLIYVDPSGHEGEEEFELPEITFHYGSGYIRPTFGAVEDYIRGIMGFLNMDLYGLLAGPALAAQARAEAEANEKSIQAIESKGPCRDVLLLGQATEHWKKGKGQPICVDASSVKISGVYSSDFASVGDVMKYRTKILTVNNDFLVYGTIELFYMGNNQIILLHDNYGFEMHEGRLLRNIETAIAGFMAGDGMPYDIFFKGIITIETNR